MKKDGKMARKKSEKATIEQVHKERKKRKPLPTDFQPGEVHNPTGKGGFGDNPHNINIGGRPKNQDSITAQYRIMLNMTQSEINDLLKRQSELTVAQRIALARIKDAMRSGDSKWLANASEITDRTEGKAKQSIEADINGAPTALVVFREAINATSDKSNSKN